MALMTSSNNQPRQSLPLVYLHCAVLLIITAGVYQAVRHHHFVWDTIPFVLQNPWIYEWTLDNVIAMFTQKHHANWHPLVLLSHAVDFSLFGDDSGMHHITNLLLHLINCLLLYFLVNKILIIDYRSPESAAWIAFLTAILFAIHPQHVESVAWVVERKDVLYTLFALSCLLAYLRLDEKSSGFARAWPFIFFCLSIGTKPMAVTLPVVLLMLDVFPRRQIPDFQSAVYCVISKAHYFGLSLLVGLVTLATQSGAMPSLDALPMWARALNALDNTWFYVAHYLWPLELSPFYPYPQNAAYLASAAFWLPGALFLGLTTLAVVWAFLRGLTWPGLLFAFYLVTLLPVSGLIHVGPAKATDHYVYLATIPLSILTALVITWCWNALPRLRLILAPVCVAYLLWLGVIAQVQVSYWNNPVALWTRVVTLHPSDPFGHRNLASGYAHIEMWEKALEHAELSLKLGSPDREYVIRLREEVRRQAQQADNSR